MIQKKYDSASQVVSDMKDGATLLVGGFGGRGLPSQLVQYSWSKVQNQHPVKKTRT
ncbi:coenzyme A transferase [Ureibacillus xyleni]|uniref:Coenzyme A transferase n=1 Tax=Ureibacillus xyleni TaxID=614648 RepID=A0A285RXK8_9BACL|nr:coenzyme A transferase [Ureibacillus xyleni]